MVGRAFLLSTCRSLLDEVCGAALRRLQLLRACEAAGDGRGRLLEALTDLGPARTWSEDRILSRAERTGRGERAEYIDIVVLRCPVSLPFAHLDETRTYDPPPFRQGAEP